MRFGAAGEFGPDGVWRGYLCQGRRGLVRTDVSRWVRFRYGRRVMSGIVGTSYVLDVTVWQASKVVALWVLLRRATFR